MNKEQLISVIIPVYNVNKSEFSDCIDSILNQTYKKLEIIIVDDGSNIDVARNCDDFVKKDKRIKVFHKKNGGVSSARNYGISKSSGQYLSFIDSDDVLDKNMYNILLKNILKFDSDISCSGYYYVDLDGREYKKYGTNTKKKFNSNDALSSFLNENSFGVSVWNKLFKKDTIKNLRFDETLKINEDRLFLYNAIINSKSIIYDDRCLYKYIKRKNSTTTSKFNVSRFDVLKVNNVIEEHINSIFRTNNKIIDLWKKNKSIYLIRLYRELILSKNSKKYKDNKIKIINELKNDYSNKLLKSLNKFDCIELFLIVRINFIYPLFIFFLTKLKFLKKIKNIIERKG